MTFPSLLDLEADQRVIVELPLQGSHVITGKTGAGKSVLAVYRAWALATAGRRVTFLTHSNLLHQYLAQMAPDLTEALDVTTYHRWVKSFWSRHFGADPPKIDEENWTYDWIEMQRVCIRRRFRSSAHLVIDEGQKLPVAFYQLCRTLGVGITVFADENQRIGNDESTVSEICHSLFLPEGPLPLEGNRRNSREIATLASEFNEGSQGDAHLPERSGATPTVLKVPSLEHMTLGIYRYFNAYPARSIGVICRSTRLLREIQSQFTRLGLSKQTQAYVHNDQYRNAIDFSVRPIRLVSTASMKGLEFDSVFVPDLDAYTEDPTGVEARLRFHILCTRAREDLHFFHRGPDEPAILSDIPESLLARSTE